MRKINVDKLKKGISGLTNAIGAYLHESVLVALTQSGHQSGVTLQVTGTYEKEVKLFWEHSPSSKILRYWKNDSSIANYAAVGLALLLVSELTSYQSFEIASFGTGVDYWMNTERNASETKYFVREARLEISGILKETKSNTVNMRLNLKKKQVKKSDNSNTSAWIAVIEFSTPKSKLEKQ